VIGRRAFDEQQEKVLETHKQNAAQATTPLCNLLGKPRGYQGEYIAEGNPANWRILRDRLANPKFEWWKSILEQSPDLWKSVEKGVLTANIFCKKKPGYFKEILLPAIAKMLDAVDISTGVFYLGELDRKDGLITQERNAKEAAERQYTAAQNNFVAERLVRNGLQTSLTNEQVAKTALQAQVDAQQQATNATTAELRRLEPNKDTYVRTLRQKLGEAVYAGHQQQITLEPSSVQALAERRTTPPAEQMQTHERDLSIADLNPLYELIIKKAQVEPQNAKALLISVMGNVKFATSDVYVQLIRKLQANVTKLATEKAALISDFEANIANTARQAGQIDDHARHAFQEIGQQISQLNRELPALRNRARDQEIEIQALRTALAARNQQQ
jgi:hypothetical protein